MYKVISVVIIMYSFTNTYSQWNNDPFTNLRLTNWGKSPLSLLEDSNHGAFIAINNNWTYINDTIPTSFSWLLHIDSTGNHSIDPAVRWIGYNEYQSDVKLVPASDNNLIGGCIDNNFLYHSEIDVWSSQIILQKLDNLGNPNWDMGIPIIDDEFDHLDFELIPTNDGGCVVSWIAVENKYTPESLGYKAIQRFSNIGEKLWGEKGIVLFENQVINSNNNEIMPIISDNKGGFFIRSTNSQDENVFIKIDSANNISWELTDINSSKFMKIISNRFGDLFRIGSSPSNNFSNKKDILISKINNNGEYEFETEIILFDTVQISSEISDIILNNDGFIYCYLLDYEFGNYNSYNSFLQKIDVSCNRIFLNNGKTVFNTRTFGGELLCSNNDLLILSGTGAQKVDSNGKKLWGDDGIIFSSRSEYPSFLQYISDNNGGFLAFWLEGLNGIWGQQVSKNGILGDISTAVAIEAEAYDFIEKKQFDFTIYPNPFNNETKIEVYTPNTNNLKIHVLNVLGESIQTLIFNNISSAKNTIPLNASQMTSGVYFIMVEYDKQVILKKIILLK